MGAAAMWEECGIYRPCLCTRGFLVLLLVSICGLGAFSDSSYLIGMGSYDITGPAADANMMGYANTEQIASGIHFRLQARSFIVAEPQGKRLVFVNIDACMASQLITIKVLERLKARYIYIFFFIMLEKKRYIFLHMGFSEKSLEYKYCDKLNA